MSISIQTNVNSLIAQENLRVSSNFQSQTIQRLTSGYRINSSADDAAGLAIANKFRNDVAELSQGVRNANDGVSQLQIMDGGMNNIGKMLDRLKTLAAQSASDSFTGNRTALNKEYQTLVNEIDRQSQAIGLSTGGHFAKSLSVFIGGGTTAAGAMDTNNGTIALDLGNSVVDSKALGLRTSEFTAASATGTNLAAGSSTSIANIVATNTGAATFELSGAGFSGSQISVTLTSSDTTKTTADKLNAAIQAAANSGTTAGNALRTADIKVSAVTDSNGNESLSFTSSGAAFQVTGTTTTANALMGKFDTTSTMPSTGASSNQSVNSEVVGNGGVTEQVAFKVTVDGTAYNLKANLANGNTTATAFRDAIRTTDATTYNALAAAGVTAEVDTTANKVYFKGNSNQSIRVEAAGDTADTVGFGAWQQGSITTGNAAISSTYDLAAGTIHVSVNGGTAIDLAVDETGTGPGGASSSAANVLADVKGAANYSQLQALGVEAVLVGSNLAFVGRAGQTIGVTVSGDGSDRLGLAGVTAKTNTIQTGTKNAFNAGANGDTATLAFSINGGDKILVNIKSDGSASGLKTAFDQAISQNAQLQAAGIQSSANLATISSSNSSVNFRMMVEAQTGTLDLGIGKTSTSSLATFSSTSNAAMLSSSGASETGVGSNNDVFSFTGLKNVGATAGQEDSQVISFSATGTDGTAHSLAITLDSSNAGDVDSAVKQLNLKLQGSNDETLKNIVAVKETNAAGTAEGIRFISSLDHFSVLAGVSKNSTATVPVGMYDGTAGATAQGVTVQSGASGAIDISTKDGAKQAVVALGDAVKQLGVAQAAVGKGQNQLSYAIGLAQSQITNFSSAQAQIRDADVASEAANLTKASVLQQANMAAMAQANSAPQAVLALLRG